MQSRGQQQPAGGRASEASSARGGAPSALIKGEIVRKAAFAGLVVMMAASAAAARAQEPVAPQPATPQTPAPQPASPSENRRHSMKMMEAVEAKTARFQRGPFSFHTLMKKNQMHGNILSRGSQELPRDHGGLEPTGQGCPFLMLRPELLRNIFVTIRRMLKA